MKKMKTAFTLAEVLITLVIIGVIAALTIPTLIQNTQKQEYVSALKKTYSTLSQAAQMIIAEEGSPKSSCETCNDGWADSREHIYELFKKHLNNVKDCGKGKYDCFAEGRGAYRYLNGNTSYNFNLESDKIRLILADGVSVQFHAANKKCSWNNTQYDGTKNYCGYIYVDLNGAKKPNQWGRDVFDFMIKEDGLYPAGCDYDGYCNPSNQTYWGTACACKVLREGAMNY